MPERPIGRLFLGGHSALPFTPPAKLYAALVDMADNKVVQLVEMLPPEVAAHERAGNRVTVRAVFPIQTVPGHYRVDIYNENAMILYTGLPATLNENDQPRFTLEFEPE